MYCEFFYSLTPSNKAPREKVRRRQRDLTDSPRVGLELVSVSIMVVAAIRKFLVSRRRVDGGKCSEVAGRLESEMEDRCRRRNRKIE